MHIKKKKEYPQNTYKNQHHSNIYSRYWVKDFWKDKDMVTGTNECAVSKGTIHCICKYNEISYYI